MTRRVRLVKLIKNKELLLIVINLELIALWHPTKNDRLSPDNVSERADLKVWWKSPDGHEWMQNVNVMATRMELLKTLDKEGKNYEEIRKKLL